MAYVEQATFKLDHPAIAGSTGLPELPELALPSMTFLVDQAER